MALYIPHSIFHLARLLYVRPETFGPYYVCCSVFVHTHYHAVLCIVLVLVLGMLLLYGLLSQPIVDRVYIYCVSLSLVFSYHNTSCVAIIIIIIIMPVWEFQARLSRNVGKALPVDAA